MYQFDYINISPDKDPKENIKLIKSFLDDMVDKLNMWDQQMEKTNDKGVK